MFPLHLILLLLPWFLPAGTRCQATVCRVNCRYYPRVTQHIMCIRLHYQQGCTNHFLKSIPEKQTDSNPVPIHLWLICHTHLPPGYHRDKMYTPPCHTHSNQIHTISYLQCIIITRAWYQEHTRVTKYTHPTTIQVMCHRTCIPPTIRRFCRECLPGE